MILLGEVLYKLSETIQMFLFFMSLYLTLQIDGEAVLIYFDTANMAFKSDKKDI